MAINLETCQTDLAQSCSLKRNKHICERKGYPIFLLRKSVIHHDWSPSKQCFIAPSLGEREPAEPFIAHQSVLRTLREGYVYVLAGKSATKKKYIRYYQVVEDGVLRERLPDDLGEEKFEPLSKRCVVNNHLVPASFMTIDINEQTLEETPFLWIAFSPYPWNKKTRDAYQASADVSRFSEINIAQLQDNPEQHPRAIGLRNWSIPVLEFMQNMGKRVSYLPHYRNRYHQIGQYGSYITAYEQKNETRVGGIVLEDPQGLLTDLSFQRNAEMNFTGDQKRDNETDDKSPIYPYKYNPLVSEEWLHKKTIAELIGEYKDSVEKYYDIYENEPITNVSVGAVGQPIPEYVQARMVSKHVDTTYGKVSYSYQLTREESATYRFNEFWCDLESQLKNKGADLEQFIRDDAEKTNRVHQKTQSVNYDYVLYFRWYLGELREPSICFSGQKAEVTLLDGTTKTLTYPYQTLSRYNTIYDWQTEIDYSKGEIHLQALSNFLPIFDGDKTDLHLQGLWHEMLSNDNGLFYQIIAGHEPNFWSAKDSEKLALKVTDKIFSYLSEEDNKLIQVLVASILSYLGEGLIGLLNTQPHFATELAARKLYSEGVKKLFAQQEIYFSEMKVDIKRLKSGKLLATGVTGASTKIASQDAQKIMTLSFFVKGDSSQVKRINDSINQIDGQKVALKNLPDELSELKRINPHEFSFHCTVTRLAELKNEMASLYPMGNFTFMEDGLTKSGKVKVKFIASGDHEEIKRMDAYLTGLSKRNSQPAVGTFSRMISQHHLELFIAESELSAQIPKFMDEVNKENEAWMTKKVKSATNYANAGLINCFQLFSMLMEYKSANDTRQQLNDLSLTSEEKSKLRFDIVLGFSTAVLLFVQLYAENVQSMGKFLNKAELINTLGKKLKVANLNELIMKTLPTVKNMVPLLGLVSCINEGISGIKGYNDGYRLESTFKLASAVFIGIMLIPGIGLVASLILVGLSMLCGYLAARHHLTPMQEWFDRSAFGLRELSAKNRQPYLLTVKGLHQSINDFKLCMQGITAGIELDYDTLLGLDYGEPTVKLNATIPSFNAVTSYYSGQITIEIPQPYSKVVLNFIGDLEELNIEPVNIINSDGIGVNDNKQKSFNDALQYLPQGMKLILPQKLKEKEYKHIVQLFNKSSDSIPIPNALDANGNPSVGTLKIDGLLFIRLPTTDGIKIRLAFNYTQAETASDNKALTIEDEIDTFSVTRNVSKVLILSSLILLRN